MLHVGVKCPYCGHEEVTKRFENKKENQTKKIPCLKCEKWFVVEIDFPVRVLQVIKIEQ